MMSIERCRLLELPSLTDDRGSLAFVEPPDIIPFEIRRVYFLYGLIPGKQRGAHGHRALEQIMIAVAGSFRVSLDDGFEKRDFRLERPNQGLYISPMIWRDLAEFSADAVCLVLASQRFDEGDYFRDYENFLRAAWL